MATFASRSAKANEELRLLEAYHDSLRKLDVPAVLVQRLDLENTFYWFFRLSELKARAFELFDRMNEQHFGGQLARPKFVWSRRATGGYYHHHRHEIGVSLAMTVEFGEEEFFETIIHEIAHMRHADHGPEFHAFLRRLGGDGRRAPVTMLLQGKRERARKKRYPFVFECPSCRDKKPYKTRRALKYACRKCCDRFASGRFDPRFKLRQVITEIDAADRAVVSSQ